MTGKRYDYSVVKEKFNERGYILISKIYKNTKTYLEYICTKHPDRGIQKIRFDHFLDNGGCPYCAFENGKTPSKIPTDLVKEKVENMGLKFVDVYYQKQSLRVRFICPIHEHKGVQDCPWPSIKKARNVCSYCNGTKRTTEDFREIIKNKFPDIEVIGEYTGAKKRIKCKCLIHNYEWEPLAYNLLSGYGCPHCGNEKVGIKKRTSPEEKMERLTYYHPNILFSEDDLYNKLSHDYISCECKICGCKWKASYSNLTHSYNHTGCPKCAGSNSERKVAEILTRWGYSFIPQMKFEDCKDKFSLPFDFYLIDFNVLIEFDGEQHYDATATRTIDPIKQQERFEKIKKHDRIKNKYCKDNNIPLVRIPYWERDDMEYFLFDQLVKLKVIEEIKIA